MSQLIRINNEEYEMISTLKIPPEKQDGNLSETLILKKAADNNYYSIMKDIKGNIVGMPRWLMGTATSYYVP
jgi:hypothetical protein